MNKYFNLCGLIFVIVILIPNIVFSITCKDGFVNHYQNKLVETLEQIGRFGCLISMFFILPFFNKGFWLKNGKSIYIILGIILVALYCIGWIIFWKEDSVRKSLYLSILPSLLFIESAVVWKSSTIDIRCAFCTMSYTDKLYECDNEINT